MKVTSKNQNPSARKTSNYPDKDSDSEVFSRFHSLQPNIVFNIKFIATLSKGWRLINHKMENNLLQIWVCSWHD